MKRNTPATLEEKAYSRGYAAGRKRERKTADTVRTALSDQADYWREKYIALRDGAPKMYSRRDLAFAAVHFATLAMAVPPAADASDERAHAPQPDAGKQNLTEALR